MSDALRPCLRAEELPDLLVVAEVAAYLRTTPGAVRQMIHKGTLPVVRIGSRVRIRREALLALCRVSPPSPGGKRRCP